MRLPPLKPLLPTLQRNALRCVVLGLLLISVQAAFAQQEPTPAATGDYAVGTEASFPQGAALTLGRKMMPDLDARLILNPPQSVKSDTQDNDGFTVHAKPKLGYYGLFADYYVRQSAWRLTAGLAYTGMNQLAIQAAKSPQATVTAVGNGQGLDLSIAGKTYKVKAGQGYSTDDGITWTMGIDGIVRDNSDANHTIQPAEITQALDTVRLNTDVRWPTVMPYVGLGYNSNLGRDAGWGFTADFGVFVGKPTVDNPRFTNSCTSASCSIVNQELTRQGQETTEKLRSEMRKLPVLPKIALGVEYRF